MLQKCQKFGQKCQQFGISWSYLEPPWEIHWNKYKHIPVIGALIRDIDITISQMSTYLLSRTNASVLGVNNDITFVGELLQTIDRKILERLQYNADVFINIW